MSISYGDKLSNISKFAVQYQFTKINRSQMIVNYITSPVLTSYVFKFPVGLVCQVDTTEKRASTTDRIHTTFYSQ